MIHSQRTLVLPLAAIIDRATAHEPAARYPDVPALLADIRRYRAHIPVSAIARPPWRYVTQSFLRRHRAGAMITGAVLAIMAVATTISTVQYVRAERALDEADARFADARGAANYLIFNLQDRLDTVPRSVQLRRESVGVAQHYLNRLAQSAMPASTGLRAETAAGLVRLAEAEGVPGKPNIDAPDLARRDLDHALALLAGGSDARSVDLQILALTDRAHLADYAENRNDQAMHDSDGAMALAATHRDGNALIRARMLAEHADVLAWHDDWRGSDEAANQALGVLGTDRGLEATLLRGAIADDHANAAEALHRHDDAVRQFQAAIAIFADATRRFGQSWRARRELAREQWLLGANAVDHHPDARSLALLDAAEQGFAALARDDGDDQDIPRLIRYVRADRARTLSAMGLDREAQEILTALIADDRAQVLRHPGERQWLRDLIIDLGLAGTARSAMAGLRKAARSIANSMPRSPGFRRWETNMACH
jgi:serine/threonine-protein kinase